MFYFPMVYILQRIALSEYINQCQLTFENRHTKIVKKKLYPFQVIKKQGVGFHNLLCKAWWRPKTICAFSCIDYHLYHLT